MKKIAMALAAVIFAGAAFAADVTFYNKLYENGTVWEDDGVDSETKFPGIKDKMNVEYKSEHVDTSLTAIINVQKDYGDESTVGSKNYYLDGFIDDWYMEWRLIQAITIGLHDNIYADASKLVIADDEMEGGNIGSDGFTVVYRPAMFERKLRLAVTTPFEFTKTGNDPQDPNWLKGKKGTGDTEYIDMGIGAIYTDSAFQIGFTAHDIMDDDERIIGVTLNLPEIAKGLTLGAGFTSTKSAEALSEEINITGENIINAQLAYVNGQFHFDAETVIGLDAEQEFDKYFGVMFGYDATEKLSLGAYFQYNMAGKDSLNEDDAWKLGVTADVSIDEHNSIGFEFNYATRGDFKKICVPVYWKWTL